MHACSPNQLEDRRQADLVRCGGTVRGETVRGGTVRGGTVRGGTVSIRVIEDG